MGQGQPAWWSGSPSHSTPPDETAGWKPPTREEAEAREAQMRVLEDGWMTTAMASDWNTFKKEFPGDRGIGDARAAVRLMLKARRVRAESSPGSERTRMAGVAYRTAWGFCLRAFKNSKDAAARQLILDEWNKLLSTGGKFLGAPFTALSFDWDRAFFTDDFWRLLEGSKDENTLAAMCQVMIQYGNRDDYERLRKKAMSLDAGKELGIKKILSTTLYRMYARLSGGGAAQVLLLPHVEE
jgi:hypothetical protein